MGGDRWWVEGEKVGVASRIKAHQRVRSTSRGLRGTHIACTLHTISTYPRYLPKVPTHILAHAAAAAAIGPAVRN